MKPNKGLANALENFKKLGWLNAQPADAPNLPLGTAEEQKISAQGLQTGDWGEWGEIGENSYGWIPAIDVNEQMLALYAIRCGVDARRATSFFLSDTPALYECIWQRGPAYARQYLQHYYRSPGRTHEHTLSVRGVTAVNLAHALGEPQENIDYLKDWAAIAHKLLTGSNQYIYLADRWMPTLTDLQPLFAQHLRIAAENSAPVTGALGKVIKAASEQNLISQTELLEICLTGLELAGRPGDRKTYAEIITRDLAITDQQLLEAKETLTGLLATGEAPLIEAFSPRLIQTVSADEIADIALPALYGKTKKTQKLILQALKHRPALTSADALPLADRLNELATGTDKTLANQAKKLLEQWNLASSEETQPLQTQPQGWWQPTPPVWEIPAFIVGESTVQTLAEAVNSLRYTDSYIFDLEGDRLLALAVELARTSLPAVRLGFGGATSDLWMGAIREWVTERPCQVFQYRKVSHARMVLAHLGQLPSLLSTPSKLDSSITFADFCLRLHAYAAISAQVLETDLLLALLRVDWSMVSPEQLASLPSGVPVSLANGEVLEVAGQLRDAAQVVRAYVADPVTELQVDSKRPWLWEDFALPASLVGFSEPYEFTYMENLGLRLFPHWQLSPFTGLLWTGLEVSYAGLCAEDAAYQAQPLPPAAAINLLALQRPMHSAAAPRTALALQLAWERGLLRPGMAEVSYLDWSAQLSDVASLARALGEVAELGLLSVVWPVLDDLLVASQAAPRLVAGTAQVAEVMLGLLPEVLSAVTVGLSTESALLLPGLRRLAARKGSSQAVQLARQVVAQLPVIEVGDVDSVSAQPQEELAEEEFARRWPVEKNSFSLPEDGARILKFSTEDAVSTCPLPLVLTVPNEPDVEYVTTTGNWYYALNHENQLEVRRVVGDTAELGYLRWEGTDLVFSEHRNWREADRGPLEGEPSPRSLVLAKVLLADLATSPTPYSIREIVKDWVQGGILTAATTSVAVRELLEFPEWSPARAVYLLEAAPELLVGLWPLLTESLVYAALQLKLPRWTNRVLDIVGFHAPLLAAATARRVIPAEAWEGLRLIAEQKGSSTAIKKARELNELLYSESSRQG